MTKAWILVAALAAAGCSVADRGGVTQALGPQDPGTCFFSNDLNNFNIRSRQTAYVSTKQGYVFRLDAPADCFSVGTPSLTVDPFNSVGPRVCVGSQANVGVGQARGGLVRCIVRVSGPIRDSAESGLRSRQD